MSGKYSIKQEWSDFIFLRLEIMASPLKNHKHYALCNMCINYCYLVI